MTTKTGGSQNTGTLDRVRKLTDAGACLAYKADGAYLHMCQRDTGHDAPHRCGIRLPYGKVCDYEWEDSEGSSHGG